MEAKPDLVSYSSVGLSYENHEMRFGYDDQGKNANERILNRAILNGYNRLFQIQSEFLKGLVSSESVTVRQFRDSLISIAIGKAIRCAQVRDCTYSELTTHAKWMWTFSRKADFWPSIPPFDLEVPFEVKEGFYGPLGSLAFTLFKNDKTGDGFLPIDLIDDMVSQFWQDLGQSTLLSPEQRHLNLLDQTGVSSAKFSEWTTALTRLDQLPLSSQHPEAPVFQKKLRQLMLNDTDWGLLKQRFILGEIVPEIIPLLDEILEWAETTEGVPNIYGISDFRPASYVRDNLKEISAPAGMPLVYLVFAIEGYNRAARLLSDSNFLADSLNDFYKNSQYDEIKFEVSRNLALCYDAWSALARFNTLLEAGGFAYRDYISSLNFLISSREPDLSNSGITRLLNFDL